MPEATNTDGAMPLSDTELAAGIADGSIPLSKYWSVTAELVVCQGGDLTAAEAEDFVRDQLQRLIGTGVIFGAFLNSTSETPGEDVDPLRVARR